MADVEDVKIHEVGKGDTATSTTVKPESGDKTFYQRHKTVIWIVVALVVFAVAAAIGVGIAKALENNLNYHRGVWRTAPCPKEYKSCPSGFDRGPLIIVGLNGFTGDMFNKKVTPHIWKMRDCGAHTPNMSGMFPLSTYPNYYSIATGLYPDEHGVIDDFVVDEDFSTQFVNGTDQNRPELATQSGRWYNGEPIWTTARRKHLKSASFLWPGSNVPINGWLPNYFYRRGGKTSFEDRVEKVIEWLKRDKRDRPDVIMLYLNATSYGNYRRRERQLRAVDKEVGNLMGGLSMLKLKDCANVLLVADHLLVNTSCSRLFVLERYINDVEDYQVTPDWLNGLKRMNFTFNPFGSQGGVEYENPETTVDRLKCRSEFVRAYQKEHLPARLHYAKSPRIEDVVIVGSKGYSLRTKDDFNNDRDKWQCTGVAPQYFFNNLTSRMLFVGNGFAFRRNFSMPSFRSIELYNLMAELLEIEPDRNNGTKGCLRDALNRPMTLNTTLERISLPIDCPYPNIIKDYEFAISDDETECKCEEHTLDDYFTIPEGKIEDTIKDFNYEMNLDGNEKLVSRQKNAPWGVPTIFNLTHEQPGNYCLLFNNEYLIGWDNYLRAPKFESYTLIERSTSKSSAYQTIKNCMRQDVRLPDEYEPRCEDYRLLGLHNLTMGFLKHPGFAFDMEEQMGLLLTSNTAPMYTGFLNGIWEFLHVKMEYWSTVFHDLNVIVGPGFDANHDGKLDKHEELASYSAWIGNTPIPTHYWAILTRCHGNKRISTFCPMEDREYMSFIFPHSDGIKSCRAQSKYQYEYLKSHFASIGDIELMTGLRFFPDLEFEDHLRLQMITPELLWEDKYYKNEPWD
ncbi:venom phosphodiesterase 2-like isoform X2 [Glandiceps talaboti]